MGLLPNSATLGEVVSDFVLQHTRGGVSLSPVDTDLLLEWEQAGMPSEVICRGITEAAKAKAYRSRPDDRALRSLRECRRAVEAEWEKHKRLSVGGRQP